MNAPIPILTWTTILFPAPLFLDLALALVGNLLAGRRQQCAAPATAAGPRLAVVIPAHNEEAMIACTIASLLAAGCVRADRPEAAARIFVVAHNCTDRTAEVAARAGAVVVVLDQFRGKGAALRRGFQAAAQAGAEAFVVVDADSTVEANLLSALGGALAAGAEAAQCRYELAMPAARTPLASERLRMLAFRGMNVLRARGRAALGLSAGLFGNGFALTARLLESVPYDVDSICEDLEYNARLVAAGRRVVWVEETAVYAQPSAAGKAQTAQEARWEGGRLRVAWQSTPALLHRLVQGHAEALATLAELWSLPLSRGLILLPFLLLSPLRAAHLYALFGLLLSLFYVLASARLGSEPARDLAALTAAPLHLLKKIMRTPAALRQAQRHAEWTRTSREVQPHE